MSISGSDRETAEQYIEACNGDVAKAVDMYMEQLDDEEHSNEELSKNVQATSSKTSTNIEKSSGSSTPRVATLSSLKQEAPGTSHNQEPRDLYAGGEKSGLSVQDPYQSRDLVDNILRQATEGGQQPRPPSLEHVNKHQSAFGSGGMRLGGDGASSERTDDSPMGSDAWNDQSRPPSPAIRTLTFWRNGFSIDDGPLYRSDDPSNRHLLEAISSGRAPLSVLNVQPNQEVEVHVQKRLDEDFVEPKKKRKPYEGRGQRLGSPTPDILTKTTVTEGSIESELSNESSENRLEVDESLPIVSLHIRLGDGTRIPARFNASHTVGDIYQLVDSTQQRNRSYILQTTFPNRELDDKTISLADAKLANAMVVQKWV